MFFHGSIGFPLRFFSRYFLFFLIFLAYLTQSPRFFVRTALSICINNVKNMVEYVLLIEKNEKYGGRFFSKKKKDHVCQKPILCSEFRLPAMPYNGFFARFRKYAIFEIWIFKMSVRWIYTFARWLWILKLFTKFSEFAEIWIYFKNNSHWIVQHIHFRSAIK